MSDNEFSGEIRERAVSLTVGLYRVTDLLPKEEHLRMKLRQTANEILLECVEFGKVQEEKKAETMGIKIDEINALLEIAQKVRFAHPLNFLVLKREYGALSDFCKKAVKPSEKLYSWHNFIEEKGRTEIAEPVLSEAKDLGTHNDRSGELNERQKAILTYVKSAGEARLSDFFEKFKDISSKTIQRDLHYLVEKELLKRQGERRWTIYRTN